MEIKYTQNAAKEIFSQNREIIIAEIKKRGGDVKETMERMIIKWREFLLPLDETTFSIEDNCIFHAENSIVKPRAERAANANANAEYHANVRKAIMSVR